MSTENQKPKPTIEDIKYSLQDYRDQIEDYFRFPSKHKWQLVDLKQDTLLELIEAYGCNHD